MTSTLKILTALTATMSASIDPNAPDVNKILERIGGISIIGLDGKYIEINEKYAGICGYRPEELVGKEWSVTVHPDDLQMAIASYKKLSTQNEITINLRGIRKDGSGFKKTVTFFRRNGLDGNMNGHYCLMSEN